MAHYKIEARDSGREKLARLCGGGMASKPMRAEGGSVAVKAKRPDPLARDPTMTVGKGTMGAIAGLPTAKRLDKFARGGGVKKKGDVNIIIAPPSAPAAAAPMAPPAMMGPPPGASMPPPGMPPRPMAPSPGGTPPMGGAAPMMRKRGGRTVMPDAGAGSGVGRLEKAAMAK